jgi:hypothetical protein
MRMDTLASDVAGTNKAWAANDTCLPAITLSKVKSQMWMSHPYWVKARRTQMVTPAPKI